MKNKKYIVYLVVSILVLTIRVSYEYFKVRADTWYENNLLTNCDKYISKTAIYCNDRSVESGTYSTSSTFNYGTYTRLSTNKSPSYKCGANTSNGLFEVTQAVADKFSASTTGEVNEMFFSSPYAWYYTNSQGESITDNPWWSLSSSDGGTSRAYVWYVIGSDDPGRLDFNNVQYDFVVRPAISLSSCATIKSGNGTPESPYEIDESSCS